MKTHYLPSFLRDLKALKQTPAFDHIKALAFEAIPSCESLDQISNLKKLKGADAYRIRAGDYRLGIFIEDDTVTFARVLHRRDIYRYSREVVGWVEQSETQRWYCFCWVTLTLFSMPERLYPTYEVSGDISKIGVGEVGTGFQTSEVFKTSEVFGCTRQCSNQPTVRSDAPASCSYASPNCRFSASGTCIWQRMLERMKRIVHSSALHPLHLFPIRCLTPAPTAASARPAHSPPSLTLPHLPSLSDHPRKYL